jgi:predicted RNase H-like HicB family nuclease/antitoxin (DNA-binding transcriptional repressor) of toxin-antitoxin stability system
MKRLDISTTRQRLPALLATIARTKETIVVTRYGSPLAVLAPVRARKADKGRYPLQVAEAPGAYGRGAPGMKRTFTLEYWADDGWYVGKLREVPGVFSQGETLAELTDNIADAYRMMLASDSEPVHAGAATLEVGVEV